ncbi:MAG: PDZ domain-containing protein [Myxococcaceae bacterium]|nr:PDZ domain-containing protein [Myxococcaceae bacterium]
MSLPVSYRVSLTRPNTHLYEVQAHFPPCGETIDVQLPAWTPGSYLVREYARHVQHLTALTMSDQPLRFERLDKATVRIHAGNKPARLQYQVYANELTVRTSHLDATHGYFNGATLFFFCEALRDREHRVAIHAPDGWNVHTALPRQGMEFLAPDYDTLVDSPFEVSPAKPLTFLAAGVPHEVVLWGEPQLDEKKLVDDLRTVVETEAKLYGGLPKDLQRYLFIIHAGDKGRGGLEHKASTVLLFTRNGFQGPRGWEDFLTLATHEYFHLWNVKRVKPRALVPFDYSKENYTELLWAFEGGTSYYDNLLVRRAGLMSASRYLTRFGESLTALHTTPGRLVQKLVDASVLSWIKHYRPDEHTANSAISYYLKGEIVCCLLDLELRKATKDTKSLDDVMRALWARYGDGSGVPEDGVEAIASELAGVNLKPFFDRALRSTEELDYSAFAHVGLEVRFRIRESAGDKGGTPPRLKAQDTRPRGYLGVTTRGSATIATVLDGTPALEAGLCPDDEVVALDGWKCDASALLSRTDDKKPGEQVVLTVFRRDKLLQVPVTLGQRPSDAVYLVRTERPTEEQKAAFRAWLGVSWDDGVDQRPTL